MPRTAPAPNMVAIPGMNPGSFVAGGGGDGGGGSGGRGSGSGNQGGADGSSGQEDPNSDGVSADECGTGGPGRCTSCSSNLSRGDPVEVGTGRVHTRPVMDAALAGPLPFSFRRTYSSHAIQRDSGLGFGWQHNHGWTIELRRRVARVWDGNGTVSEFPIPAVGATVRGPGGAFLTRDVGGFTLIRNGLERVFAPVSSDPDVLSLTVVKDPNHNRIELRYQGGHLSSIVDSVGREVLVHVDGKGHITGLSLPHPSGAGHLPVVSYGYDAHGNLVSVTDSEGCVSSFTYDDRHRLLSAAREDALTFFYRYDRQGRCVETWGTLPDGSVPGLASDVPEMLADGRTRAKGFLHTLIDYVDEEYREVIDSISVQRIFVGPGGLNHKSVSGGSVTSRTFDDDGNLTSHTDARGATTVWHRDEFGEIVEEQNALGERTRTLRDEAGRPLEVADELGTVMKAWYDARGNPLTIVAALGDAKSTEYNDRGLPIAITRPDGGVTRFEYDQWFNIVRITNPDGRVYEYAYDGWGRVSQVASLSTGATTRFAWNGRWQPTAEYEHTGDTLYYRYDRAAQCVEITKPNGRMLREHNGHGQTTRLVQASGAETRYGYTREGFLTEVINENGETMRLTQDAKALVRKVTWFDQRTLHYDYDEIGNLTCFTNGELEETKYEYDALSRPTSVVYADGAVTAIEHGSRGKIRKVSTGQSTILYERNAGGLPTRETHVIGERTFVIEREYDALREVVQLRTSLGLALSAPRNLARNLERIDLGDGNVIRFFYDASCRERRCELPGGAAIETEWDAVMPVRRLVRRPSGTSGALAEPEWIGALPPGVLLAKTFTYSPAHTLVSRTDQLDTSQGVHATTTDYEYDPDQRLLRRSVNGAPAEEFRHDGANNVAEATAAASFGPGDRVVASGGTSYVWDRDGRLTEKTEVGDDGRTRRWVYRWNAAGLLAEIECPDGRILRMLYDGYSRRVQKAVFRRSESGTEELVSRTYFVWDQSRLLHELVERFGSGAEPEVEVRSYVHGLRGPLAHRVGTLEAPGEWVFYVNDVLDTPEELISGRGDLLQRYQRAAYGHSVATLDSPVNTPLRFPGQYADEETGLHYNQYRYYDPVACRYISPDPAGGPPDLNVYRYCRNPIDFIDPLGLHSASAYFVNPNADPPIPATSLGNYDSSGDERMFDPNHTNNAARYREADKPALRAFNMERFSDTEAKAIRDCEGRFSRDQLEGGTLVIKGDQPPCTSCRGRMEDFAARNRCNVEYTYPRTGTPRGRFASSWREGVTANSTWDHPQSVALPQGGRTTPAGYNREDALRHGYAGWRPPRPDATPGW